MVYAIGDMDSIPPYYSGYKLNQIEHKICTEINISFYNFLTLFFCPSFPPFYVLQTYKANIFVTHQ